MNDIFQFKKFSIRQNPKVFKVGTDGVLAGCLADVLQAQTILDIGTGTGLLALMVSQRNPKAQITAIDSEPEACKLAKENIKNSPFSNSISIIHSELQNFISKQTFDYIICNPPFFDITVQLHQKHPVARHQIKLNYESLLKKSKELLSDNGYIGYIFPYEEENKIISLAEELKLYPEKIVRISGIKNGKIRRTFLELGHFRKELTISNLFVEESPRVRSESYNLLTQDFYL